MIYGLGIDMVEVARIERAIERWGHRLIERVFTPHEMECCSKRKSPHSCFALRLAAKEAFSKSIGLGMSNGVRWKDIEVVHDTKGKPEIKLYGEAYQIFKGKGLNNILLSLTDEGGWAIAAVVLEG
ncbi:MAG TPA: holo-ACP synthase [Syntrophaceae bacterium]|nr:holo-ACP synthase [Syntrophaceae bacterium]